MGGVLGYGEGMAMDVRCLEVPSAWKWAQGLPRVPALAKSLVEALAQRIFVLLAILILSAGNASASDWQYAYTVKEGNVDVHQFFDADSISHPVKGVTRVWVKTIRARDLDRYLAAHTESIVGKASRKFVLGYTPKFLTLRDVKARWYTAPADLEDATILATGYEVMANASDLQTYSKLYFEIDCVGKRMRLLEAILFGNGRDKKLNKTDRAKWDYEYIAPDSNGQLLSLLACPRS